MSKDYIGYYTLQDFNDTTFFAEYSTTGLEGSWHSSFQTGDLFMRTKTGENSWSQAIRIVGEDGVAGQNGSYVEYQFAKNTSSTTPPTTGWVDSPPTIASSEYLWMRMRSVDGEGVSTDWSAATRISGEKGPQGIQGPAGQSVTSVDVQYYLSTSSTALSGGSWSTTAPTWVDGRFMWSKTVTTYSTGDPTESTPVCISGATGSTGATGRGVSSIVEEFYLSTSKTTQTGGSWSTTMPTWSPGKYVWTRSKITYTSGSPATETTTPLVSSEWEVVNEIQVGGRNLVRNSSFSNGVEYFPTIDNSLQVLEGEGYGGKNGAKLIMTTPATITPRQPLTFTLGAGETLLVQVKVKEILGIFSNLVCRLRTKFDPELTTIKELGNDWKLFIYSYTNNTSNPIIVTDVFGWYNATGEFILSEIKVEKGSVATDWTPAPEDVDADIAGVQTNLATLQNSLGSLAYTDAVEFAKLGTTIIEGGYFKTGLVDASRIDTGTLNAARIAAGSIATTHLAADAITADKIAAGAVAAEHLAADSVTADKIVSGAITTAKLAAQAVTANEMAVGTITAASGIIADAAITTAKIADASITDAKISNLSASKLTAGTIDASVIDVINLNASNITSGQIDTDVIYVGDQTLTTSLANMQTQISGLASGSSNYLLNSTWGTYDNPAINFWGEGMTWEILEKRGVSWATIEASTTDWADFEGGDW